MTLRKRILWCEVSLERLPWRSDPSSPKSIIVTLNTLWRDLPVVRHAYLRENKVRTISLGLTAGLPACQRRAAAMSTIVRHLAFFV